MSDALLGELEPLRDDRAHVSATALAAVLPELAADEARRADGPTALAPLWRRVVTGQSFAWRIRRVRNRIRWARRRTARRMARWIRLHPELGHAARAGTLGQFLLAVVRARPDRPRVDLAPGAAYRPGVVVVADLAVTTHRCGSMFDGVELHIEPGRSDASLSIGDAGGVMVAVDGPAGSIEVPQPVDLTRFSPSTFQRNPPRTSVVALEQIAARGGPDAKQLLVAQQSRAVVCDPTAGLSASARGRSMAQLACAGVPLVGTLTSADAELVGEELASVISSASADDIMDDRRRELYSLRTRRAALSHHSPRGWWSMVGDRVGVEVRTTPHVSVLLASNRANDVVAAAGSVARQRDVCVQLVVGLHGAHMPADLDHQLADAFPGHLVIRRFDDHLNLGQVLNGLTDVATCDLVSKWDDDDWYESQHLADLVRAMEFSGAGLVGKAAEFVYLEALDVTIRRFATGREGWSTTIAGGTLMVHRVDIFDTGWPEVARQVDRRLIDDLQARGKRVFRTHGFGYVLRRRRDVLAAHTWAVGDDYFLRQVSDQRAGLDLEFAGFGVEP